MSSPIFVSWGNRREKGTRGQHIRGPGMWQRGLAARRRFAPTGHRFAIATSRVPGIQNMYTRSCILPGNLIAPHHTIRQADGDCAAVKVTGAL